MNERVMALRSLSDEERRAARYAARDLVIPPQPKREEFENRSTQRYSPKLVRISLILLILLLGAAFTPSAIRLFQASQVAFETVRIPGEFFGVPVISLVKVVAGIATVATAEIGQIVFLLSISVLLTREEATASRMLWIGAIISTIIAFLGNLYMTLPSNITDILGYMRNHAWKSVEALAPTILVIIAGYTLKYWALRRNESSRESETHYQEAMRQWEAVARIPENDVTFMQHYANKLLDALYIRQANMRGKRQLWSELTNEEKNWLVQRELAAERWFDPNGVAPKLEQ